MIVLLIILAISLLVAYLVIQRKQQSEGIFDYYYGMPGIQKTYISTGYIR